MPKTVGSELLYCHAGVQSRALRSNGESYSVMCNSRSDTNYAGLPDI